MPVLSWSFGWGRHPLCAKTTEWRFMGEEIRSCLPYPVFQTARSPSCGILRGPEKASHETIPSTHELQLLQASMLSNVLRPPHLAQVIPTLSQVQACMLSAGCPSSCLATKIWVVAVFGYGFRVSLGTSQMLDSVSPKPSWLCYWDGGGHFQGN